MRQTVVSEKETYWEVKPSKELESFVEAFWFYQPDFVGPNWDILIPEGVVDIIFNFGAPYYREPLVSCGKESIWVDSDVLVGQRSELFRIRWPSLTKVFAVRVKAESAHLLVQRPMSTITDRVLPLEETLLPLVSRAIRQFKFEEQSSLIAVATQSLLKVFEPTRGVKTLANLLEVINARKGGIDLRELSADVGMSRRTLERLFEQKLGLTPKLYARIIRMMSFLRNYCPNAQMNLTDSALRGSFYDQSHFIKEFRIFTGESPSAFFSSPPEIYQPLIQSLLRRTVR